MRPDWREFAGDYTSEELGVTYTVFVEDGRPDSCASGPRSGFTLEPVFKDAFVGDGNTIRFTRSPDGAVDGLRIYAADAASDDPARRASSR